MNGTRICFCETENAKAPSEDLSFFTFALSDLRFSLIPMKCPRPGSEPEASENTLCAYKYKSKKVYLW